MKCMGAHHYWGATIKIETLGNSWGPNIIILGAFTTASDYDEKDRRRGRAAVATCRRLAA